MTTCLGTCSTSGANLVNEETLPTLLADSAFTAEEHTAILVLNEAAAAAAIPDENPPPQETVWATDSWQQLARTAEETLTVFTKRGEPSAGTETD